MRQRVYDRVRDSFTGAYPIENQQYRLELSNVDYDQPEPTGLNRQKNAIISGRTLHRSISGDWNLVDRATEQSIDRRRGRIAQVPHVTDRGTFIYRGNEYTVANQMRLKAGVFTRRKENGELESHFNILPGTGPPFRIFMDPNTGVFNARVGQSKFPVYTLLKSLGVKDEQLQEAWGRDLLAANKLVDNSKHLNKAHEKFTRRRAKLSTGEVDATASIDRVAEIRAVFDQMALDPAVMQDTLGKAYQRVDPEVITMATKKLFQIHKGEVDTDDRDNISYQTVMGPEDLFSERISKDAGRVSKNLLWKATFRRNLDPVTNTDARTKQIQTVLLNSGLGIPLEEVNPAEILDQMQRISRMGEGGIPSTDSIPEESRAVQPSYLGFIDPIRTSESVKAGVDNRIAYKTMKGDDGQLYTEMRDKRGRKTMVPSGKASLATIAFPGEIAKATAEGRKVRAMVRGRLKFVDPGAVDYELPSHEDMLSSLAHLVPFVSAIKGHRMLMGAKMTTQALAMQEPEAPLVQTRRINDADPDDSFEKFIGGSMGGVRSGVAGVVQRVTKDSIEIRGMDGKIQQHELYHNFPLNRKSFFHSTSVVKPGQMVNTGDLLARSNFTDEQGHLALGKNLRVGYLPYKGLTFEDAIVISEDAAKRLTSEHMYQHDVDLDPGQKVSKRGFLAKFPSIYPRALIDKFDDSGVIKKGMRVSKDDPLVLSMTKRQPKGQGVLHRAAKDLWTNASEIWKHDTEGIVTDTHLGAKAVNVVVKTYQPMQVGDKLCYAEGTEVLTRMGWKLVERLTCDDYLASLNPETGMVEWLKPKAMHSFAHNDKMYSLETTQVSLLVTANHYLYALLRGRNKEYQLLEAEKLFGRRYRLKNNALPIPGLKTKYFHLGALCVPGGQGARGIRVLPSKKIPMANYLALLGAFISEGSTYDPPNKSSGVSIAQTKPANIRQLTKVLDEAGVHWTPRSCHSAVQSILISSRQWREHFHVFGKAKNKFIPPYLFDLDHSLLQILFDWLMWGDGHKGKSTWSYTTTSIRLAGDFQRLCLHLGMAANIRTEEFDNVNWNTKYTVIIYRSKNRPTINHGHASSQRGQHEQWVDYDGTVYCPELERNHVVYVRRHGKPCWCGNSNRQASKGVISRIVPNDQMPRDGEGNPLQVLMHPFGVISRTNPSILLEAALGKVAAKVGKAYKVDGFSDDDFVEFVQRELARNGLSDTETVFDPERSQNIPDVFVGNQFFMKLHHTAESKLGSRGDEGSYTADQIPGKQRGDSSKRIGTQETTSLLSAGATETLRDAKLIRGQRNDDFWRAFRLGYPAPTPDVPFVYKKFLDDLKGAGINVKKKGNYVNIMALTDKDITEMSRGPITVPETLDFEKLNPIPGGLFDLGKTGGHSGCFHPSVKIWTDRGMISIGEIVNKRLPVRAWSYDFCSNQFVLKPVVSWFKNRSEFGIGKAKFSAPGRLASRFDRFSPTTLWGTSGHQVLDIAGNKHDLSSSTSLAGVCEELSYAQQQVLYGSLLGDAHIPPCGHYSEIHCLAQRGYLRFKQRMFGALSSSWYESIDHSGGSSRVKVRFRTKNHAVFHAARAEFYRDGVKRIQKKSLDKLDDFGLAIWFMDDGSASRRPGKNTARVSLHSEGFTRAEVDLLRAQLHSRWGLQTYLSRRHAKYKDRDLGWVICLSGEQAERLLDIVSPYIHPSMQYKLLSRPVLRGTCCVCNKSIIARRRICNACSLSRARACGTRKIDKTIRQRFGSTAVVRALCISGTSPADPDGGACRWFKRIELAGSKLPQLELDCHLRVTLTKIPCSYSANIGQRWEKTTGVYDIEVADTHNYFANGILVSNSGWSHIDLHEPVPSPVMEDPIRRLLNLTTKDYREVIAGRKDIGGLKGGSGIKLALQKINVDAAIDSEKAIISSGAKSKRDASIKRLRTLTMFKKTGIKPEELVLTKAPVLPPQYRPISRAANLTFVSDPNYLYKELMLANNNLKDLSDKLGYDDVADERLGLYDTLKSLTGLGDPIQPKLQEQRVRGILSHALGLKSSPKYSSFQRKVIGSATDLVGRAVITPNPSLTMDQVGLPEDKAWVLYRPFIMRDLIRRGVKAMDAANMVANKNPKAKDALLREMDRRPVLINRAPTLHRYGIMAAYPVLTAGNTLQVSPLTTSGFNADFDGDAEQFHVPVSEEAVREAKEKLMPSRNLTNVRFFDAHYVPAQEFLHGLFKASRKPKRGMHGVRRFATVADVKKAYMRGELPVDAQVRVG